MANDQFNNKVPFQNVYLISQTKLFLKFGWICDREGTKIIAREEGSLGRDTWRKPVVLQSVTSTACPGDKIWYSEPDACYLIWSLNYRIYTIYRTILQMRKLRKGHTTCLRLCSKKGLSGLEFVGIYCSGLPESLPTDAQQLRSSSSY